MNWVGGVSLVGSTAHPPRVATRRETPTHGANVSTLATMNPTETHTLTVFNAVDLPAAVQWQVWELLAPYNPDTYQRDCDADGRAR